MHTVMRPYARQHAPTHLPVRPGNGQDHPWQPRARADVDHAKRPAGAAAAGPGAGAVAFYDGQQGQGVLYVAAPSLPALADCCGRVCRGPGGFGAMQNCAHCDCVGTGVSSGCSQSADSGSKMVHTSVQAADEIDTRQGRRPR
jgi:hypothetical protein